MDWCTVHWCPRSSSSYASPNVFFSCGTATIYHTRRQNSNWESSVPRNNLCATGFAGSDMHSAARISFFARCSPSYPRAVPAGAGDQGCGSMTHSRLTWQNETLCYTHATKTSSGDCCRRRPPTAPTGRRQSSCGDAKMDTTSPIIFYGLVI